MQAARVAVALDYRPAILTSSGIGRAVRELARALAARSDIELHLFAHSLSPARRTFTVPTGAHLHRLPIPGRSLPLLAQLGLAAPRLCGRPSLFHWTDYVHPPVGDTPAVLTIHDLAFAADPSFHGAQSDELLARTSAAARGAALVITPTQATADAVAEHLDVSAERLAVIPFGADHGEQFSTDTTDPHPKRGHILALGTIEPRKNHENLIQAWRHVPDPKPKLVVVGRRGWECAEVVAALEAAQARGELTWHEDFDDAEVHRHIQHATVLVYPSLLEGFGFPPLEALALGVPVVAGETPALRETLGDAASFCDPRDPLSIAQAINEIVRHGAFRQRLRERGPKRAAELTWSRTAELHANAYARVLLGTGDS